MLASAVSIAGAASITGAAPIAGYGGLASGGFVSSRVAPSWVASMLGAKAPWRVLRLTPPCALLTSPLRFPCDESVSGPDIDEALPATSYAPGDVRLPSMSDEMGGTLGGFFNLDLMKAVHLSAGPELSWLTPDSPREDLLRLRVVAPGWGIRYSLADAAISIGVAACTRFVMLGEDFPVVDVLTSEARIEFVLP